MHTAETAWADPPSLSDRELKAISRYVYEKSGITLHSGKKALVIARLQKRVVQGGFGSFDRYLRHVQSDATGDELTALLDAIATNHTSFFRESKHFDFLRTVVLPPLATRLPGVPISAWSAACSSGEEPYTIAISCLEQLGDQAGRSVRLLASDLSTKVLTTAKAGIYTAERVSGLPPDLIRKYFDKGIGAKQGSVRVAPVVRQMVDFRQINLLEVPASPIRYDFIFCRNVMIYFDQQIQQRVVDGLERRLAPGGYLFISHSESLNGVTHALTSVAPAIYRKVPR